MGKNRDILQKEDYEEKDCLLCTSTAAKTTIPRQRISAKIDGYMEKKDYSAIDALFDYWLKEARAANDTQGEFFLFNEMLGVCRKCDRKDEAYQIMEKAKRMIRTESFSETTLASYYINAATVCTEFHDPNQALNLFSEAETILEAQTEKDCFRLASLYNNMAACLSETERYDEAEACYQKALSYIQKENRNPLEEAITYLNMLDLLVTRCGLRETDSTRYEELLKKARLCLDDSTVPQDSYYAFVAGKCLPIYEYFGYFRYVEVLKERIRNIHERT